MGLIPESGRSPGEGNGSPLQYSCLENLMQTGGLESMGSQRIGHHYAAKLSLHQVKDQIDNLDPLTSTKAGHSTFAQFYAKFSAQAPS